MSMSATPDSSSPTTLDDVNREKRGEVIEILVCEILELIHTEPDDDEPDVFDARFDRPGETLDGRPVEIKSCLPWISDSGSLRRGRFWINRRAHEELVARDGVYVFAVVDPESTVENPEILEYTTVPANEALSDWLTWTACGRSHMADQSSQFVFTRLFPEIGNFPKTRL